MKKIAFLLILAVIAVGCSSDDDGGNNTPTNADVSFKFSQNWAGTAVTPANYQTGVFTNAAGNFVSIDRLRYLISRIVLHKADGTTVAFDEYQLIDLDNANSLTLNPTLSATTGDYTGISFVYGFNEQDNVSGAYPDLNSADWSWPSMLGGGYHFMQMDGTFDDMNGDPQPYNFHNGTARVSEDVFEQTFITFDFDMNFTISDDATIEIKMDISEWYKNPFTWDLNERSTDLMMSYIAQIDMNRNGKTVFSIGAITQ
jgi:hypothetical protein